MTGQPVPELTALLAEAAAAAPVLDPTLPLEVVRKACDDGVLRFHPLVRDHGPLHEVRDLHMAGVPCRLYLPAPEVDRIHVHLHGGGWWMGSLDTVDPMARELAHVSGLAVLSVGYRLAPEHRFPAGLDDVTTVLSGLPILFPGASISVGGESAGANLAAAACLRLRGTMPLVAQWLDVPCVDLRCPEDESLQAYASGYGLEMAHLPLLQSWYCDDIEDPLVSPALATDLTGLPPAIVTTSECDPLRDQGARYADALRAARNEVFYRCNPGQVHASSWFTGLTAANGRWFDETAARLVELHVAQADPR